MDVLVVGGGGREHALAWKLRQSPRVREVFCAPGNAGIASVATCVPIPAGDLDGLLGFARERAVGLTVVGPEAPLAAGLVDLFERNGLRVFGASRAAAELEGSKSFAKELMQRHGIPTAAARTFTDAAAARAWVRETGAPLVVKADGLAAGKGVVLCRSVAEAEAAVVSIMEQRAFGAAGDRVLIEEFLVGEEASFLGFTDGVHVVAMPSSQDHKAVFDADQGPNTGGMGAYSPAPVVTPELHEQVMRTVMVPTVRAMAAAGRPYRGVL
jgi:phosphoribosylamine--glycine ligase